MRFTKDKFTLNVIIELIRIGLSLQQDTQPTQFILAKAEVKPDPVEVKNEYLIYLKIYGVPIYGYFEEHLLQKIREEFNI
jgi:hypothetical protein